MRLSWWSPFGARIRLLGDGRPACGQPPVPPDPVSGDRRHRRWPATASRQSLPRPTGGGTENESVPLCVQREQGGVVLFLCERADHGEAETVFAQELTGEVLDVLDRDGVDLLHDLFRRQDLAVGRLLAADP